MKVYLAHHGQHWLPREQQRPFTIPGWATKIPIGGRLEITTKMLRRLSRPVDQTAESFATFLAGVYNANRSPDMLEVQVETDEAAQPPNQNVNPGHDYAGSTGAVGPVGEPGIEDEPGHKGAPGPEGENPFASLPDADWDTPPTATPLAEIADIEVAGFRGAKATDILRHPAPTEENA